MTKDFDREVWAFKRNWVYTGSFMNVRKVDFEQWPDFEQRAYRWSTAVADLWTSLAEHPLLRWSKLWRAYCMGHVRASERELLRIRAEAEAMVWERQNGESASRSTRRPE
jgi:hypothetical protein